MVSTKAMPSTIQKDSRGNSNYEFSESEIDGMLAKNMKQIKIRNTNKANNIEK